MKIVSFVFERCNSDLDAILLCAYKFSFLTTDPLKKQSKRLRVFFILNKTCNHRKFYGYLQIGSAN